MKSNSTHRVHQTARTVLITTIALVLLFPQGLAAADSVTATAESISTQNISNASPADSAKVKFTKEEAVAKLKELFPSSLKDATASNIELGSTNSYPAPLNQMVWNIQWQVQSGNNGYGFSSQVDAITGDLINIYMYYPRQDNEVYYPPKVSKTQALEIAQAFIGKAASSIKSSDLQLDDNNSIYGYNDSALFGPVQYNFSFQILKNGLPSTSEYVSVTIDGNGEVTQFNKPSDSLTYPSAQPKITQEQAVKKFSDEFDVGLYYIPVTKNGKITEWILGWRPAHQALNLIDAMTGKKLNYDGTELSSVPVTYSEVAKCKVTFQSRSSTTELSGDEVAKLVEKVAYIPANRKLVSRSLTNVYQEPDRKVLRLTWSEGNGFSGLGFPVQSSAEVDPKTGEILQFRGEDFVSQETKKPEPAPAGGKKLNENEAKAKAIELINQLYPSASQNLKLINDGGDGHLISDGTGYRYQFIKFHEGIPVSDSNAAIELDLYGRMLSYYGNRNTSFETIISAQDAKVNKKEALESYANLYQQKLKYAQIGGYTIDNSYVAPKVKLVYESSAIDKSKPYEVLNAVTGKWISIYDYYGLRGSVSTTTDLKGHSAEQELTELVKYNVITPDAEGKVNPDQEITVGDWLTLVAKATYPYYSSNYSSVERKAVAGVSPDNSYYDAVSFAAERSWIKRDGDLQPEKKLTREELAVLLTNFLKYNKISTYLDNDITVTQFSDSSSISNKGAVALVVKLGLLKDENGKFNPQGTVTKGLAASVMMKMVLLQGKTDQMIGQ